MRNPRSIPRSALALAALGALALTPARAAAQRAQEAPAPPKRAQPAQEDEGTRELRRVLHLTGGGTLRAVTRFADGVWERKTSRGWEALPVGSVDRAVPERLLLSEMRRREKAARKSDSVADRVALAEWMVREGLRKESVAQIDRVLEADPDQPQALDLLGRYTFFRVPTVAPDDPVGSREAIVSFAVNAPPSARELAIRELAASTDRDAMREELTQALRSPILVRRAFGAQALGRLFPGEEVRNLLMHAVLDPSEEVRERSSVALAAPGEPAVIVPVVRALESQSPRVRAQAGEALGHMGFTAAVEPLVSSLAAASAAAQSGGLTRVPHSYIFVGRQFAYVQDFDVEVAQFQAVADPQVNTLVEGEVLDVGVHSVTEYGFAYQSKVIRGSLAKLTGENPGYTARAWLGWWEKNQDEWRAADRSAPEAGELRTAAARP